MKRTDLFIVSRDFLEKLVLTASRTQANHGTDIPSAECIADCVDMATLLGPVTGYVCEPFTAQEEIQ